MGFTFVFPGQGAQSIGMGQALAKAYSKSRKVFEEVDDALDFKLSKLIWEGSSPSSSPISTASKSYTISIFI